MTNVFTVEQLFTGRLFRVPDYQRGYAWEPRHRLEFLEDLEMLGPGREHYTGTVVLHEVSPSARRLDAEGKSYGVFDIVDGQQRLTTIVLLLDAMRRALIPLSDVAQTLADGVKRSYVAATDVSGQPLFRLVLNTDCDHYFKTVALNDKPGPEGPQISSEARLAEARREFQQYIENARAEEGESFHDWLTSLYWKVTNQLRVSLYEVESAAEVGVIFEVMNNRGKALSELEKVKNYLLYAGSTLTVDHDLASAVNFAWAEIFRQLMSAGLTLSTDEDQLLRAHWLAAYDPQPRKWAGSKTIKERFDLRRYHGKHQELLDELLRYTEGLRASCTGYCDARSPERTESFASLGSDPLRGEVKTQSARLIRTNVIAPFLPVLIATRNVFAEDSGKYLELVKLCELFAFRVYRLLERRADAGQGDLFRIGFQLQKGKIDFAEATREIKAVLVFFCPDSRFEEALTREAYDWYAWAGLKYFLYEYEEHLARTKGAVPKVSWNEVRRRERADSIEHVLPQTATASYWQERFDESARLRYTHDLGNLALTKDNAAYSNKPFPDKRGKAGSEKPCYADSPFFMEREIAAVTDWDVDALVARRNKLRAWAAARWHVDLSGVEPATPIAYDDVGNEDADPDDGGIGNVA